MTTRYYPDKIVEFLEAELEAQKNTNQTLTRDFFEHPSLKQEIKEQLATISRVIKHAPAFSEGQFDLDFELAMNEFRNNRYTDIPPSISLKKSQASSWLTDTRQAGLDWHYSERYFTYLQRIGRSSKIIAEARRSSLEVLKKIGDPDSGTDFYIKGMVFGSVQSGKTTNFNAVINGAIDLGYPMIIVLSGIMEDLRVQTQLRVEDEVIGYGIIDVDKSISGFKGVGDVKKFGELSGYKIPQVVTPTSPNNDFNMGVHKNDFPINQKNILICKKNTKVLSNLVLWLSNQLPEGQQKHSIPFLLVDDEADNASLNNMGHKGKEYATSINGNIRALLGLFRKKTYLGYTATPFANVLADRNEAPLGGWPLKYKENGEQKTREFEMVDNLAPDDFVELLFPPSIYIGAKHFFETRMGEIKKIEPLIAPPVDDYHDSFPSRIFKDTGEPARIGDEDTRGAKKGDLFPQFLPESLHEAIRCYVIATAIRLSRRPEMIGSKLYQRHNSMLIHVSRFTDWQNRTKKLVQKFVVELTKRLNTELPGTRGSVYAEMELTWIRHYAHIVHNIKSYLPEDYEDDFLTVKDYNHDIKPNLLTAITGMQVVAINSGSPEDALVYGKKTEKKYIAIGGNKLSRGFTLEGLTINYFIRNTDFADTLLQMGRWFGYRPGYLDCCKLFTTRRNIDKFDSVSVTVEELEETFREINRKGGKPKDFEIRVRDNPKVIKLTRDTILKNAETFRTNYSGGIEQSTKFKLNAEAILQSWNGLREHIGPLDWSLDEDKDIYIHSTDAQGLFTFLNLQNTFYDFDLSGVREYIQECNTNGKLRDWKVGIRRNSGSGDATTLSAAVSGLPGPVKLTTRSGPKKTSPARYDFLDYDIFKVSDKSAQIVTSGSDFGLTLDSDQMQQVKKQFRERKAAEGKKATGTVPDKDYRSMMSETDGIMMIYLIDTSKVFTSTDGENEELQARAKLLGIDKDIPIFGYALGFPEVKGDFGGYYRRGKRPELHSDEEIEEDEFPTELNEE